MAWYVGNPEVTDSSATQRASYAEDVSMARRQHAFSHIFFSRHWDVVINILPEQGLH